MLDSAPSSPLRGQPAKRGKIMSEAQFRRLWTDPKTPVADIAQQLGVTYQAVSHRAKLRGLPTRGYPRDDQQVIGPDRAEEFTRMWAAGVMSREIATHFGTYGCTVAKTARRLGLPARGQACRGKVTLAAYQTARELERMAASAAETRAAFKAAERASQLLLRSSLED